MTKRPIKDIAASTRSRLQNKAQTTSRPFQEVLQYYAMERFLYRLSQSKHSDKFILKGALMLAAWRVPLTRSTRDIDLLGRMDNDLETVTSAIRDISGQDVEPDGLTFDSQTVEGRVIKEDADYPGVRVTFVGKLQNSRIAMQIDVGFGDVIEPAASLTDYPTILDLPAPQVAGYSRETTVAEKFEAMVKLGLLNSRMKDFFDVWILSRQFDFDGPTLARAIQRTFANRGTLVSSNPTAFAATFGTDAIKTVQWQAFLRKSKLDFAPAHLQQAVDSIAMFLRPVAESLERELPFTHVWRAPGPWMTK